MLNDVALWCVPGPRRGDGVSGEEFFERVSCVPLKEQAEALIFDAQLEDNLTIHKPLSYSRNYPPLTVQILHTKTKIAEMYRWYIGCDGSVDCGVFEMQMILRMRCCC